MQQFFPMFRGAIEQFESMICSSGDYLTDFLETSQYLLVRRSELSDIPAGLISVVEGVSRMPLIIFVLLRTIHYTSHYSLPHLNISINKYLVGLLLSLPTNGKLLLVKIVRLDYSLPYH